MSIPSISSISSWRWILGALSLVLVVSEGKKQVKDLLLMTVATEANDGFNRYLRSARVHGLNGKVLGMNEEWRGGDMNHEGGGHKVNLFKKEMEAHKDSKDVVVLFTDSYDVVITQDKHELMAQFDSFKADIVFGAEGFCWPDNSLQSQYPKVSSGYRFLNSGGIMGYANVIYELLSSGTLEDTDDDQLFYTKLFLDEKLRDKLNMKLDTTAKLFQNLNGAQKDIELKFDGDGMPYVMNIAHDTEPAVLHGNGFSKIFLNTLANYVPKTWNKEDQCTECLEGIADHPSSSDKKKNVLVGVFISKLTPFIDEFFEKLLNLDYPHENMDYFLYNNIPYHEETVQRFIKKLREMNFRSVEVRGTEDRTEIWHAKNMAIDHCASIKCDYFFNVDSEAHLDNPKTLKLLMEQNRGVIAPMLVRPEKAWSNFWGALSPDGYYARSLDYMDIVHNDRRGLWNVPYISSCYLINSTVIQTNEVDFIHRLLDPDMALCEHLRAQTVFMYVSNRHDFGHLVNNDGTFNINNSDKYNEMWEIFDNPHDWEARYLHENYSRALKYDVVLDQPCPDVFHFPIFTKRFAFEFVEVMEAYGKWSGGSHEDERLEGGYEAVPTRDIHMKQVNFDPEWMEILRKYVNPIQKRIFTGHDNYPPRSHMNFVVRYKPEEQANLRPHHDSSTYTVNTALNEAYEGGGCRFLRYNCSIINSPTGWMIMHPGRLTHYHEGLTTTKGTRYIMISFIDP